MPLKWAKMNEAVPFWVQSQFPNNIHRSLFSTIPSEMNPSKCSLVKLPPKAQEKVPRQDRYGLRDSPSLSITFQLNIYIKQPAYNSIPPICLNFLFPHKFMVGRRVDEVQKASPSHSMTPGKFYPCVSQ